MKIYNSFCLIFSILFLVGCGSQNSHTNDVKSLNKITSAHAGFGFEANSMDAFLNAIDNKFRISELDLYLSTDKRVIVAHPPLNKYYNTEGNNTNYNDFLKLNFKNDQNLTFKHPPTIEDIVELSDLDNMFFAFDVKFDIANTDKTILNSFINLLKPNIGHYVIYVSYGDYSFESNKKEYDIIRSINKDIYLGFVCLDTDNCNKTMDYIENKNAYLVTNTHINLSVLDEAEKRGIRTEVYVENNISKIYNYFEHGVDVVMSDTSIIY